METQNAEVLEQNTEALEQDTETLQYNELSELETLESMQNLSEMRRDAYTELVSIHLQALTKIMMSSNNVSALEKRHANKALVEAITFALNFGIKDDNQIRNRGNVLAKETNNLAGVLVQALDNRMVLLANLMRKKQIEETVSLTETETNNEQTSEEVKES